MKNQFILMCIVVIGIVTPSYSQLTGFGIQPKVNLSQHINVVQSLPKRHARLGTDKLGTIGVDLYADFRLAEKWKLRTKLGLEKKGFAERFNPGITSGVHNEFKYVSTDLLAVYELWKGKNIQPYVTAGFTVGRLYGKHPESFYAEPKPDVKYLYIVYEDYAKFNLGYVAGVGISFKDVLWVDTEFNRDIISPYRTADVVVWNSVFSVNVGINALTLIDELKKEK